MSGPSPRPGEEATGRTQRLPPIWNMPFLRNPHFTGRDALLEELHRQLTNGRVALTAVRGMGGVGKTQLALEYAYRHAGDLDLVWWLRAEEPATLLEDYARLAGPLELAESGEGELAALAAAVCRALTRRARWLLVFDNANAPDELEHLLPKGGGGHVLITSRNPSWPFASELDVPTLSRPASVGFLLERTGQHDETAADALAAELGDLPLALEQAAAYMVETGSPVAAYLVLFRTRRTELWAKARPPAGYPATVGTTWTMAVERLRSEEPRAVDLLNLCAFLAPEAIPRTLLTRNHAALPSEIGKAVADPLRLNRLVGALRRYSLIEVTGEGLSVHRLVQAAARDGLGPDDHRRWVDAGLALMRAGFASVGEKPYTWASLRVLLDHARAAADHAQESKDSRYLFILISEYLTMRGEFTQAKENLERVLRFFEGSLGPEHPKAVINKLRRVLQDLDDLAGAKAAYERTLRIGGASPWPGGLGLRELRDLSGARATHLNSLGGLMKDLGELAGARAAFERALGIDEAIFGPDHPNVARDVNNLGGVLQDLGDLAGARTAFERALPIFENQLGSEHPNVATLVNNLGSVLRALGDLAGAKAAFERALRIDEASFGPDHPNVAIRVNNLGSVLREEGDLAGARAAFERALAIFERFLGPDHPNTRTVRANLDSLGPNPGPSGPGPS